MQGIYKDKLLGTYNGDMKAFISFVDYAAVVHQVWMSAVI